MNSACRSGTETRARTAKKLRRENEIYFISLVARGEIPRLRYSPVLNLFPTSRRRDSFPRPLQKRTRAQNGDGSDPSNRNRYKLEETRARAGFALQAALLPIRRVRRPLTSSLPFAPSVSVFSGNSFAPLEFERYRRPSPCPPEHEWSP